MRERRAASRGRLVSEASWGLTPPPQSLLLWPWGRVGVGHGRTREPGFLSAERSYLALLVVLFALEMTLNTAPG